MSDLRTAIEELREAARETRRILVGLPSEPVEALIDADVAPGYLVDLLDSALAKLDAATQQQDERIALLEVKCAQWWLLVVRDNLRARVVRVRARRLR